MQKWEYIIVQYRYEREKSRPRFINGNELKDWKKGPELSVHLNQLGEQGWELIQINGVEYIYKRPRP